MAWPKNRKACFCVAAKYHIIGIVIVSTYILLVEAELQFQSSERMTSLHSRLQQEAEKIRKWKNATELDIKHKVANYISKYI